MISGYFTCVLRAHFKEVLDHVLFRYSLIKKNDVIPAYEIYISVEMNDVNYDVDRSKDIYLCFQADKYMHRQLIERYIAFRVLGEDLA